MSAPNERADQEVASGDESWVIEGIDLTLTPLQYHYLSLLQRLIKVKNDYQTDPNFESWLMAGINKAIYSTLRDSIEANIGDAAKELLHQEHQVN
jgi:hypothetical protein